MNYLQRLCSKLALDNVPIAQFNNGQFAQSNNGPAGPTLPGGIPVDLNGLGGLGGLGGPGGLGTRWALLIPLPPNFNFERLAYQPQPPPQHPQERP